MNADELSPAMLALKPRQRRFVWEYLRNRGNASAAAEQAGYPVKGKNDPYIRIQAHRLLQQDKVRAAIEEVGKRHFGSLLVPAIRAAEAIIANPKHPKHAEVVLSTLSRLGLSEKTDHTMTVQHSDMGRAEMLARIGLLARELGLDPALLLGEKAVPMKMIEGRIVDGVDSTAHTAAARGTPDKAGELSRKEQGDYQRETESIFQNDGSKDKTQRILSTEDTELSIELRSQARQRKRIGVHDYSGGLENSADLSRPSDTD
jgi:hypothetical protein